LRHGSPGMARRFSSWLPGPGPIMRRIRLLVTCT
jgi:hypothetical protein